MYDMKLLSTYKATQEVAGKEDSKTSTKVDADDGKFSWLLVKGRMTETKGDNDALGVFVKNTDAEPVITRTAVEGD